MMFLVELFRRENAKNKNGKILIVSPCLIGEFVASIPAIYDFINRHPHKKIDLLVTPQLELLAKKISGIHKVFITKSVYVGRSKDKIDYKKQEFGLYEMIFFLRISELAYVITFHIKDSEIRTSFVKMFAYVAHLVKSMFIGRTPKSWRSLNFDILGGKESDFPIEKMFSFNKEDYDRVGALEVFKNKKDKIIIHVGTKWSMKRWDKDRWVELLKKMNKLGDFHFIFVGGEDDVKDYEYISSRLDFKVESLIKKISLSDLILVLKKAEYFIGIDSGPSNMAHLVGLRSMTIYGPGPHMYMPSDPEDVVFDKTRGRGLYQLLFKVGNSYINRISVNEVHEAFLKLHKKNQKSIR